MPDNQQPVCKITLLANILEQAVYTLGSQELMVAWLLRPAAGLGNKRPLDLTTSVDGLKEVDEYLTRMEYGVYT